MKTKKLCLIFLLLIAVMLASCGSLIQPISTDAAASSTPSPSTLGPRPPRQPVVTTQPPTTEVTRPDLRQPTPVEDIPGLYRIEVDARQYTGNPYTLQSISVQNESAVEEDAVLERTVTVLGAELTGQYERTWWMAIGAIPRVDCYYFGSADYFRVDPQTGACVYYYNSGVLKNGEGELKTQEECVAIAWSFLEEAVADTSLYALDKVNYYKTSSNRVGHYIIEISKKFSTQIGDLWTNDTLSVGVTEYGNIYSFDTRLLGSISGETIPTDNDVYWTGRIVNAHLSNMYCDLSGGRLVVYDVGEGRLTRLQSGETVLIYSPEIVTFDGYAYYTGDDYIEIPDFVSFVVWLDE